MGNADMGSGEDKIRGRTVRTALLLVLLVLLAGILVWRVTTSRTSAVESIPESVGPEKKASAAGFIEAVRAGNAQEAIALANGLVDTGMIPSQGAEKYALFFRESGIRPEYLHGAFNILDHVFWRRRVLFHDLAHKMIREGMTEEEMIFALFEGVTKKLGHAEDLKGRKGFWPEQVWSNKNGLCDRQSWVLFELLRSVGFKPVIVLLFDSKGVSFHTILTVYSGGKAYILDPLCKVKKPGMSMEEFLSPAKKEDPFVTEYRKLIPQIDNVKYSLFFSPQEYVMRNIRLGEELRSQGFDLYLTEDMQTLADSLLRTTDIPMEKFTLSSYPFALFSDDLQNNRMPDQPPLEF